MCNEIFIPVFKCMCLLCVILVSLAPLHVYSDVLINDEYNITKEYFRDIQAEFGPRLSKNGVTGYLILIHDLTACHISKINPPPFNLTDWVWIALVMRGKCNFVTKVYNVQKVGYGAAIVFNNESDTLLHMGGSSKSHVVTIPSVFISRNNGLYIGELCDYSPHASYSVTIDSEGPLDMNYYLVPFAAVVGCCFLLMLLFMVGKWFREYRNKNKARVSKKLLRTIPTKKFSKGDDYDLCAICLEDYDEGDKLRELPCAHMYHCKCIDLWLTKSRGTCPVCKRKVFPHLQLDSDSDDAEANNDNTDERTPLLSAPSTSGHGATEHTGAINSAHTLASDDSASELSIPGVSIITPVLRTSVSLPPMPVSSHSNRVLGTDVPNDSAGRHGLLDERIEGNIQVFSDVHVENEKSLKKTDIDNGDALDDIKEKSCDSDSKMEETDSASESGAASGAEHSSSIVLQKSEDRTTDKNNGSPTEEFEYSLKEVGPVSPSGSINHVNHSQSDNDEMTIKV